MISLDEPALETPYFALSWLLTWFAHDVPDLDSIARLFDLFLASHPLMPLYLAAVAIKVGGGIRKGGMRCGAAFVCLLGRPVEYASRSRVFERLVATISPSHLTQRLSQPPLHHQSNRDLILACGEDGPAVYAALKTMKILRGGRAQADALACQAAALFRARPPAALREVDLFQAVAPDAFLQGGAWHVPPLPLRQSEQGIQASVRALRAVPAPCWALRRRAPAALTRAGAWPSCPPSPRWRLWAPRSSSPRPRRDGASVYQFAYPES